MAAHRNLDAGLMPYGASKAMLEGVRRPIPDNLAHLLTKGLHDLSAPAGRGTMKHRSGENLCGQAPV